MRMASAPCLPRTDRSSPLAGLLAAVALTAAGCTTGVPRDEASSAITPVALLAAEPLVGAAGLAELPDPGILVLDDAMRAFLAEHLLPRSSRQRRMRDLLNAVIGGKQLDIAYTEHTYTAREAFGLREANCLSFTNLFVALGRAAGLEVAFQEVDVPPDWTRDGDVMILNRHINAIVTIPGVRDQVVDFNIRDFRTTYERRPVSDQRAEAHFHSNMAVERMKSADVPGAVRHFRRAVAADSGFTPAWVNLGTLYQRNGHAAWAHAAWRHALELDPSEVVALSNLERLERERGRVAEADSLQRRLRQHRLQNPYYRFHLAQAAFDTGQWDEAISHLHFAVRRKTTEDRFMALLGLSYLQKGDTAAAAEWLARAAAVSENPDLKSRYHSKLEMLKRVNAG